MKIESHDAPGITYSANLPLSWSRECAVVPGIATLRCQTNLDLLRALATLEAVSPERDHESDAHFSKAIERLEAKLDVALTMLAKLVADHNQRPDAVPVTLGVNQIEWRSEEVLPGPGENISIILYLSPRLPEPLVLEAKVNNVVDHLCTATLVEDDPELKEWMTRTLFRYHRRALQTRHSR